MRAPDQEHYDDFPGSLSAGKRLVPRAEGWRVPRAAWSHAQRTVVSLEIGSVRLSFNAFYEFIRSSTEMAMLLGYWS